MIEVVRAESPEEWNALVDRSEQATPFHRYEMLSVVAEHSGSDLLPFVGFKGQEPIGIFPVYSLSKGPFRTALSPPPELEVNYLGPATLPHDGAKQRRVEKRQKQFVDAVLEVVEADIDPHYVHVRTGEGYADVRPFIWNGFRATPRFTYAVDLDRDIDDLFMSFSADLRKNVNGVGDTHDVVVAEGDVEDIGRIIRGAHERHAEQGVGYSVPPAFVQDLYRALPPGTMRVYTLRVDGEYLGGTVTVEDETTVYRWQTVADLDSDVPVADLLDWELIQRSVARGQTNLDLVGANLLRLCNYKAKFNPSVRTYYELERGTMSFDVAKRGYMWLRSRGHI